MKKRYLFFICISLIILFQTSLGISEQIKIPKASTSFYVYDEANVIDSQLEQYIVNTNKELYKKTGSQVVIASINSLNGADIRQYANSLFERWQIGSKQYDNGLLILLAPEERQIWIEVGYGLEGALPDSKLGHIIEDYILPYFKEEKYSDGILFGFNEIITKIEEEYNIQLNRQDIDEELYYFNSDSDYTGILNGIGNIFIIIAILIFLFIDFRFFNGWITFSIIRGSGNRRGGGRGSSGGGRSGGGGAGGSW